MAISKITYKSSPSATPETWMDATGATAAASDITSPKTAMLADGVVTTGTGTAPTGTKQISITQNGTTTEDVAAYANAEITVDVQGGGGGGFTTIASGTFIGSNNSQAAGRQFIQIGNKMAQTDFFVLVKAKNGEEFTYDSNYKWVWLYAECRKMLGYFDLSTAGNRNFISSTGYSIDVNNSDAITTLNPGRLIKFGVYQRNNDLNELDYNTFQIVRDMNQVDGFQIYLGHSNVLYPFAPITYEYEVVYFGNDPGNDIIDLS